MSRRPSTAAASSRPSQIEVPSLRSEEFLSRLGLRRWFEFSRHAFLDQSTLRQAGDEMRALTPKGAVIAAVLGVHGDKTYVQHAAYWLSHGVLVVASSYIPAGQKEDVCDVSFFLSKRTRTPRFKPVSPDRVSVAQAMEVWRGRLAA